MDAGSARPSGRGVRWAAWALAAAVLWPAAAGAERVALVIGNGAYEHVQRLPNPGNDATDVGAAFEGMGYAVTRLDDAGFDALRRGLLDFTRAASAAEVAVVFYAGHGIEVDGRNFLVPVDARLQSDRDVEYEAVPLSLVTRAVGGARRLGLVVLDACRDNPFVVKLADAGATRSIGRGLARVAPSGGTLVAYAAEDGKTAADGAGRNSPYTGALLRYLEEPGLEVGRLFRKVRAEVERTTGGAQTPIEYGKLPDADIYLASAALPKDTGATAGGTPDKTPPPAGDAAKAAYKEAKEVGNVAAMLAVVKRFPGTFEADLAQAWIDKHEQPIVVAGGDPDGIKPGWEVGEKFRDCPECPEMVVVREGRFRMGSTAGDDDERPVHEVTIARQFAVGVHEVTFAEWDACVSDGGCGGYRPDDVGWGRGERPAINVSWNDAKAYVRWLSGRTGEAYRLLSESEWEYVARAGTTGPYHFGLSLSSSQANYGNNRGETVPVGSYPANAFGLHDVHGNVWEWVEDCWNDSYHGAPSDGSAWESGECGRRVLRGGSWSLIPGFLRSAYRNWLTSGLRDVYYGFRVARTLTP